MIIARGTGGADRANLPELLAVAGPDRAGVARDHRRARPLRVLAHRVYLGCFRDAFRKSRVLAAGRRH